VCGPARENATEEQFLISVVAIDYLLVLSMAFDIYFYGRLQGAIHHCTEVAATMAPNRNLVLDLLITRAPSQTADLTANGVAKREVLLGIGLV
jgi:hypothetical protein